MTKKTKLYKVIFHNQGMVYEVFAREVGQGGLFGFVEVEKLVFGSTSSLVIDPSEDRLRHEFADVERIHIPMHSVIRIDEVSKEGTGRIVEPQGDSANVASFPIPVYTPSKDRDSN